MKSSDRPLQFLCILVENSRNMSRERWRLDDRGIIVRFPTGIVCFSVVNSVQAGSGAVPSGIKQLLHEAGRSHPSGAEVTNGGAVPAFRHSSSWHGA